MIWEKLREGGSKEGAERQEEGRAEDETQSFAGGKAGRRRSRRRGAGEERSCLEAAACILTVSYTHLTLPTIA